MSDLSDSEINNICDGYVQNHAKVRYLERMGLTVRKKPNGRPLVNRNHYDAVTGGKVDRSMVEPKWSTA